MVSTKRNGSILVLIACVIWTLSVATANSVELGSNPNSANAFLIDDGGNLYGWGYNFTGELGDGTRMSTTNPVTVLWPNGVTGWSHVASGAGHALAISKGGKLYTWGSNHAGQLGYGYGDTWQQVGTPMLVPFPQGVSRWVSVSAGNSSTHALGNDGQIYGCGANSQGDLGIGVEVWTTNTLVQVVLPECVLSWTEMAAGEGHAAAIASSGALFAWGENRCGQVGIGNKVNAYRPMAVLVPDGFQRWSKVVAGVEHTVGLADSGELYAWGRNDLGQLGIGNTNDQTQPLLISRPPGVGAWKAVAAGAHHTLALGDNGKLYAWGYNYFGQLGQGYTNRNAGSVTPILVPLPAGSSRWVEIGATGSRSMALDENCRVLVWGGEGNGLGGSSGPSFSITRPTPVAQLTNVCTAASNVPPVITLISPANGAVIAGPTNVVFEVQASDADGEIKTVEFYLWGSLLGIVTNPPFRLVATNLSFDTFPVSAIATDDRGARVQTPVSIITVYDRRYFNARINFQPPGSNPFPGYSADCGQVFGERESGLFYGWNADNSANMIECDLPLAPDRRYSTLAYMQRGGDFSWEIAVPNGFYQVHIVRGDPLLQTHFYQMKVENWIIGDNQSTAWDSCWLDPLEVTDGRISISNSPGASNNSICFVEIQGVEPPPTLSITADDAFAQTGVLLDGTTNTAKLTITRVGLADLPLDVNYSISGTAKNGVDFTLDYLNSGSTPTTNSYCWIEIPAGQSSVSVLVRPIDNDRVEVNKTAVFTVNWNSYYKLASNSSATITISNINFIASSSPPAIRLVSPEPAVCYSSPTDIKLEAEASSAAGTLQKIDFVLNGTNVIGTVTKPPFSAVWSNAPAGYASLSLRALNTQRATILTVPIELLISGSQPYPQTPRLVISPTATSSYLIDTNGMLFAWGMNQYGQLGIGTTTDEIYPVTVAFPAGVRAWREIAAGRGHAVAIGDDGLVYSCGQNNYGQLGNGNTENRAIPQLVCMPTNTLGWRIAVGTSHSLSIDGWGQLYAWGKNVDGELGDGSTNSSLTPRSVFVPAGVSGWSAIAAGNDFSVGIGSDGNVYSWGRNNWGQLGNNTTNTCLIPTKVALPSGPWLNVAVGNMHAFALKKDGVLYGWGYNILGQLGAGTMVRFQPTPLPVSSPSGSKWISVAAGGHHSLALASDGRLYAWGDNGAGLGVGASASSFYNPKAVLWPTNVSRWLAFTTGLTHQLAIGDDGNLYSWGSGTGLGSEEYYLSVPTKVSRLRALSFKPSQPRIDLVTMRDGQFQFRGIGTEIPGIVETSTNLFNWTAVGTNQVGDSFYLDTNRSHTRFYRLRLPVDQ